MFYRAGYIAIRSFLPFMRYRNLTLSIENTSSNPYRPSGLPQAQRDEAKEIAAMQEARLAGVKGAEDIQPQGHLFSWLQHKQCLPSIYRQTSLWGERREIG